VMKIVDTVRHVKPIQLADFEFLKSVTKKTPKVTIPSPTMLHFRGGRNAISKVAYPDLEEFYADVTPWTGGLPLALVGSSRTGTATPPKARFETLGKIKAKTIQKYLGKGFTVEASLGHVKDLPKSTLGVDIDNDFETEYIVIPGKEKVLAKLKKLAASADNIYLAPDPDREGEAIAWHLAEELGDNSKSKKKKKSDNGNERIRRVTFNEITQRAVREAFEHPRDIDQHLVDAQQARRVLDRLVGYQVSPLLWDKVRRGLSAGRVHPKANHAGHR